MASPLSGGGERPADLSLMPGIASFHELEEKCELGIKLGMPAGERSLLNGSASAARHRSRRNHPPLYRQYITQISVLGPSRDSRGGLETAAEEPVGRPTSSGGENPEHPNPFPTQVAGLATTWAVVAWPWVSRPRARAGKFERGRPACPRPASQPSAWRDEMEGGKTR